MWHCLIAGFSITKVQRWPRMNTMPEWFVVEPGQEYTVKDLTAGTSARYTGKQLHAGLKVSVKAGAELRLTIE
jgi:hypothetical protein